MMLAEVAPEVLGPYSGLVLSMLLNTLFYSGKVLARSSVPREDYERLQEINTEMSERLTTLTTSVNELVTVVRYQQRNGSP